MPTAQQLHQNNSSDSKKEQKKVVAKGNRW